eukprot:m.341058 g.341058  ORF g.341058 m.341058 type:complete len:499 (-) comp19777_c0_seq1:217-1713(-)
MNQVTCYQCRTVLSVPANVPQFKCSQCGAMNQTAPTAPPPYVVYPGTVQQQPGANQHKVPQQQYQPQQRNQSQQRQPTVAQPQPSSNQIQSQSEAGTNPNRAETSKTKNKPRTLLEAPSDEEREQMKQWYEAPIKANFHGDMLDVPLNPPCICYWAGCHCETADTVQPHCCWLVPCSASGCKLCQCLFCQVNGKSRCYDYLCPCNGSQEGFVEALMWMPWYHADVCCCTGYPPKRYPGECCYFETCGYNAKDRVYGVQNDIRVRHLNDDKLWQRALCGPASWGCCLGYWLCMPCCTYMQRKDALHGDLTKYRCCQDRYCQGYRYAFHCIDNALESCEKNPSMALCFESVCCTYCAVHATRDHVWDEINVRTDPCDIRLARWENLAVQVCWPLSIALDIFNTLGQGFVGGGPCVCCCDIFKEVLRCALDIVGLGCIVDFMTAECCGTLLQFTECLECLTDCVVITYLCSLCRCGCLMAQLYPELKDINAVGDQPSHTLM